MEFIRRWLAGQDFKRARALEGEGYFDQALVAYESSLASCPPEERAAMLRRIGNCALLVGKLARSREALSESVKLAPTDPDAWLLLGTVSLELRDTTGADEAFHEALNYAPDRIDILHAQAESYALKFPRAGFEAGKRVIALLREKPGEAERLRFPRELPLVFLRNLAAEQRFVDETVAYFDDLAGLDAGWTRPVALNHKGILLAGSGRLDEAIKAYLDVLSAAPDFDAVHFNLGMAHTRKKDFEAARASFSVYAKRHPTDATTTFGFGFIAESRPDVTEMIRLYTYFLERIKANPPPAASLGRLDLARGWVKHVETVVEHARLHRSESHENTGPREVTDDC